MPLSEYLRMAIMMLIFITSAAHAQVAHEFGITSGYMENLTKDSSGTDDRYYTFSEKVRYHPFSRVEISLTGQYTQYDSLAGLSCFLGGGGCTIIPTDEDADISLYISGNMTTQRYREAYKGFNNNNADVAIGMQSTFSDAVRHRAGVLLKSVSYLDSKRFDQKSYEIYLGVNIVAPWENSFDVEVGHGNLEYNSIREEIFGVLPDPGEDELSDTMFIKRNVNSFYISPRFSRPLGSKTGINITFTRRYFGDTDIGYIFGSSNENLSPWASLWEGNAVTSTIKSFLIPACIDTAGVGYWEKRYLKTLEKDQYYLNLAESRVDYQSRFFLKVQRPFAMRGGYFIEPSVYMEYTDNTSSKSLYTYSDWSLALAFIVRK
ncbi:MAG: hypothetical protein JW763_02495 [candidate division Zixibacteria bacterium]|nr:hypothetical protein [candidate division Zixibacteria bacterium]